MGINITSVQTSSHGVWQGDNPLHFSFPLLIVQTVLVLCVTRCFAFLLKPIRQPKVIAEILGGIVLGPSALGRNKAYLNAIFPSWSTPTLETIANIGLLFFLFLVGLELDLASIRRSGRKALAIAAAGISLPFALGIGVAYVLREAIYPSVAFGEFIIFIGVALSITAFPVLARILAELKLLTTRVGETTMAAAAFNDVAAWILLALAVALSGGHKSPVVSVWILLSGVTFVALMMLVVKPCMEWISNRSPKDSPVREAYIGLALAGVFAAGFCTDLIGIHAIFGAFVFGLTVPKEGELARMLIERIEDFVGGLMLPLYFASSGLKTDVATIQGGKSWALLVLVITTACSGKIVGTFAVAVMNKVPVREAVTMGFLMNTKGLVELIVLNIGRERKVLNDECFAILVVMAIFTTFITTPVVIALYRPARRTIPYKHRKIERDQPSKDEQLRVLACLYGSQNIPSIITLIEATRGAKQSPMKLYTMHLEELSERPSSIIAVLRARRNGVPFWNRTNSETDQVAVAFEAYEQLSKVSVRPMRAISSLPTMHEDVCGVARAKRASLIILPFHKQHRANGVLESLGHDWRAVNQRVLQQAPCSVAILVDRGLGLASRLTPESNDHNVCMLFFGGPDDREALALAARMADHPGLKLTIIRVIWRRRPTSAIAQQEADLDEAVLRETRGQSDTLVYEERVVDNVVETAVAIGKSGNYGLIVIGKHQVPALPLTSRSGDRATDHCAELGAIGEVLAASNSGIRASVLVVQQYKNAAVATAAGEGRQGE
ncbi:Cation/H(+) antiporter 20 [Nymphaea thermarum]|nr:Cation/H(+) antiporter 20 [Nymphaea thermarum]